MFTLRCTRKLLNYLSADSAGIDIVPTTVLGDWYANLLFTKHIRLMICVSERSLLPVFVEANARFSFVERFRQSVRSLLEYVGVEATFVEREIGNMFEFQIGATTDRRVLGSLGELSFLTREVIKLQSGLDLMALAAEIAEIPCSVISYQSPKSMTLALLRNRSADT
jgi:hypothetical protein